MTWRLPRPAAPIAFLALLLMAPAAAGTPPPAPPPPPPPAGEPEFPALQAVEREVARMVEQARPSVVGIIARSRLEPLLGVLGDKVRIEGDAGVQGPIARRIGTGIIVDDEGHVLTLSSVVSGAIEIAVIPVEGGRIRARLRGVDDYSGLALLELDRTGSLPRVQPLVFGNSDLLKPGSLVTAFSSPIGDRGGAPAYSFGFVTGRGVSQGPGRRCAYFKFNAFTAPGSGGGPVLDSKGRLVGVLFGAEDEAAGALDRIIHWEHPAPEAPEAPGPPRDDEDEKGAPPGAAAPMPDHDPSVWILRSLKRPGETGSGAAFAVPGNVARRVAEQIARTGSVTRGWIGVRIEETEPGEIRLLDVVSGGPADKAGLIAGDRIVSFNGATLAGSAPLVDGIASSAPGTTIALGIQRDSRSLRVPLTLGVSPAPARPATRPRFTYMPGPARGPVLGVELDVDTDDATRVKLGAPAGIGLLVQRVYDDSRARRAGLQPGDLLLEALGEPIANLADLRRALRRQGADEMEIEVLRDGRRLRLRVSPALPDPAPPEAPPPPPAPAPKAPPGRPGA